MSRSNRPVLRAIVDLRVEMSLSACACRIKIKTNIRYLYSLSSIKLGSHLAQQDTRLQLELLHVTVINGNGEALEDKRGFS